MARNSPCNFWNSSAVCSGEPLNASWVAAFTNTFAGRTVSFVGDSLVRQAFLQLVCLLSAYIVDTVDTTRHRYWDCTSLECLNEFYSVQIHSPDHHRQSHANRSFVVTLQCRWVKGAPVQPSNAIEPQLFTAADVVLFGIGAFIPKKAAIVQSILGTWDQRWLSPVRRRGAVYARRLRCSASRSHVGRPFLATCSSSSTWSVGGSADGA